MQPQWTTKPHLMGAILFVILTVGDMYATDDLGQGRWIFNGYTGPETHVAI